MSTTNDVLTACSLRPGPWPPEPRTCVWCAAPLTGRARRWCSNDCSFTFTRNHNWGAARAAAIERDGSRCVRCGVDPHTTETELRSWERFLLAAARLPRGVDIVGPWDHSRWPMHADWRQAVQTADLPRQAVTNLVRDRLQQTRLEVNHRTPILGRHGKFGCHHHLDGLETLCHACHVAETARQFGYRPAAVDDQLQLDMGPA